MCNKIKIPAGNDYLKLYQKVMVIVFISIVFFSCKKGVDLPQQSVPAIQTEITTGPPQLYLSASRLQLLQSNATAIAVSLHWTTFGDNTNLVEDYRIEASMAGSAFTDWVEIGSTENLFIDFTTQDFNKQIRKLFVTGFAENVILRIRCNRGKQSPLYSYGAWLDVTTYQPVINYDESCSFRIPGNFQNWKPELAPKLISQKMDGEYEGYINFTNPHSQFLMLKNSTSWCTQGTYYYIGNNMFGFGGTMFTVPGGAGIYKFNASTNTNKWSCTKIDSWSVIGSAITNDGNTDVTMLFNSSNNSWEISGNFKKGCFLFRANKNSEIVFGHNSTSEIGVVDYNGSKIEILKNGNYTISLSLLSAGNYSYSILKNVGVQ